MLGRIRKRLLRTKQPACSPDFFEPAYPSLTTPADLYLSPYTGWTRNHWDELATLLLTGIVDFISPGGSSVRIPGRDSSKGPVVDGLEGFARTLVLATPWFGRIGGTEVETASGRRVNLLESYRDGLCCGTDPGHSEYWGEAADFDQRILEAADIAWALSTARDRLWDPLSKVERERIARWLRGTAGRKVKRNNWVLAKIMTNAVLQSLDCPHSESEIREGLEFVDSLHVGRGWYQDGLTESFDYYVAWMFHDYLLKLLALPGALDDRTAKTIAERSDRFLQDYRHLFAANGSHVAFGRSLIYRSAALSPVTMSMLAGSDALDPGMCRRLCSGNLKFFLEGGMFSRKGTLGLGFTRPLPALVEGYSCGGSPYMIGRAFCALLLPADHPFWTAPEAPLPVEEGDYSLAVQAAGLLIDGDRRTGQVQVVNHRSGNIPRGRQKKYGNISYSSHFGFDAAEGPQGFNFDSSLLLSRDGKAFAGRPKPYCLQLEPGFGRSFSLPFQTDRTTVYLNTILCDHYQIRVHLVVSNEPFAAKEGGYSLGFGPDRPQTASGPDWEYAVGEKGSTFIRRLAGHDHNIPAAGFAGTECGHNLLSPCSVTPGVGLTAGSHGSILLATLVRGDAGGTSLDAMVRFVGDVQTGPNWMRMDLDGGDTLFTQIGAIADRMIRINGCELSGKTTFARVSADGRVLSHLVESH